jgi:hypothetical protein
LEAFGECTQLTDTLTIPSSVKTIEDRAFYECYGLTTVVTLNPVPLTGNVMGQDIFNYDTLINNLYVPCGSVDLYKAAPQWKSYNVIANERFVPISASADSVNEGSSITFTADTDCLNKPVSLEWQVNGKNTGTGTTKLTYIPVNGDNIICKAIIGNDTITSNEIVVYLSNTNAINSEKAGSFNLYPNPNNGDFTIEFSNPDNQLLKISIINIGGETVFETTTSGNKLNYSGNNLQAGIYLVTVKGYDSINICKVVVK